MVVIHTYCPTCSAPRQRPDARNHAARFGLTGPTGRSKDETRARVPGEMGDGASRKMSRPDAHSRRDRTTRALLAVGFAVLCAWPYLGRFQRPSLYTDDIVRLAIVRNLPLSQALVLPFNEHIAPLFELVSRAAWAASGERLGRSPWAFTAASALPWPLALGLLGRLVKKRTGSTASALAAVSVAGLSWLHVEVVEWYSASSFAWALAGILLAFESPAPVALAASALAPAFSAVGLMAGPMGALGAVFRRSSNGPDEPYSLRRRVVSSLAPLLGTSLFLVFAWWCGLGPVLARSDARNVALSEAVMAVLRAPGGVLVPALVGLPVDVEGKAADWEILGFLVGIVICGVWVVHDQRHRPLVLGGLAMILGGYAMAYGARASGDPTLLRIQRYHLLPQFGLAMLVAPLAARAVQRIETRPGRSWAIGVAVAAVMLGLHGREMRHRALCYRFPGQRATLQALERLEPKWARAGLGREQVIAVLGTSQKRRWCEVEGLNPWVVLGPLDESGRVHDDQAARLVNQCLSPEERSVLGAPSQ